MPPRSLGVALALWLPIIICPKALAQPDPVAKRLEKLHKIVERQQKVIETLRGDISKLQGTVKELQSAPPQNADQQELDDAIEDAISKLSEPFPLRGYGSESSIVAVHGFADLVFRGPSSGLSEFDLAHTVLFFHAPVTEKVEAWIEVEFEHASQEVELDQVEIRVRPFDFGLTLAAGRFYATFGIERFNWYPTVNRFISRPLPMREVVPGNWYETGIRADFEEEINDALSFRLEGSLTNGLGGLAGRDIRGARQFRDNNSDKAVTGRISTTLWKTATLGFSGSTMNYARNDSINYLGMDLQLRFGKFSFQTEFVRSYVEDSVGLRGDFRREGAYALASYRVLEDADSFLDASLRYEWVDANSKINDRLDLSVFSAGLKWSPWPRLLLKAEAQYFDTRGTPSPDTHWAFLLQIVIDF